MFKQILLFTIRVPDVVSGANLSYTHSLNVLFVTTVHSGANASPLSKISIKAHHSYRSDYYLIFKPCKILMFNFSNIYFLFFIQFN